MTNERAALNMPTNLENSAVITGLEKSVYIPIIKKSEVKSLSHVRLFATPWTVAYQAPLSMGFSREEY